MKRKRKEYRSLDSILFEDDAELEYFDVLSLLPLSNVRLEYGGADLARSSNLQNKERARGLRDLRALEYSQLNKEREEASPTRSSNVTNEEKCKEYTAQENLARTDDYSEKELREDLDFFREINSNRQVSVEREHLEHQEPDEIFTKNSEISGTNQFTDRRASSLASKIDQDQHGVVDVEDLVTSSEEDRKIEEVEDYKSIWISENQGDRSEMSRRPQILKVVDNDVTRRRHRRSVVEIDAIAVEDVPKDKRSSEITEEANERIDATLIKSADVDQDDRSFESTKVGVTCDRCIDIDNRGVFDAITLLAALKFFKDCEKI